MKLKEIEEFGYIYRIFWEILYMAVFQCRLSATYSSKEIRLFSKKEKRLWGLPFPSTIFLHPPFSVVPVFLFDQ